MSQLNFIERNPQKVLEECIERYETLSGQVLHPATPERILIDILAYRESLLREAIQDACLQNTVDNARGEFLDALGRLLGVVRLDGENDEAMRLRVRLAPERFAAKFARAISSDVYRFGSRQSGLRQARSRRIGFMRSVQVQKMRWFMAIMKKAMCRLERFGLRLPVNTVSLMTN
jgi:hypothetical protein